MVEKQQQSETIFPGIEGNKENMEMVKTFMDLCNKLRSVGVKENDGAVSFPLTEKDKEEGVLEVSVGHQYDRESYPDLGLNIFHSKISIVKKYSDGKESSTIINLYYSQTQNSSQNTTKIEFYQDYHVADVGREGVWDRAEIYNNEEIKRQLLPIEGRINDRKVDLQQQRKNKEDRRIDNLKEMQDLSYNDSEKGIDENFQEKIDSV